MRADSDRIDDSIQVFNEGNFDGVNIARVGYDLSHIDFMTYLNPVRALYIQFALKDLRGAYHHQEHLEWISANNTDFDLSGCTKLRHYRGDSSKLIATSLPAPLETLALWGMVSDDLGELERLRSLRSLKLVDPQIASLSGLTKLKKLESLKLIGGESTDHAAIAELREIKELEIREGSSEANSLWAAILNLTALKRLTLHLDRIRNVSFLESLPKLEALDLGRTAVDEKNLSALLNCQNLTEVRFLDSDRYNLTQDQVNAHLGTRQKYPPRSTKSCERRS